MPAQHSLVTSPPHAVSIISLSSQENSTLGEGGYSTTKSGAEHSGNLVMSLPAFWHQLLILLAGMAENFTPSGASSTHPGDISHQPEILAVRSEISSSGCSYFLHDFNCSFLYRLFVTLQMLLECCFPWFGDAFRHL